MFGFKNMSRDCLRQCCSTNRIIERDIESKGERRTGGTKRKEKNGRMRNKEIEKRSEREEGGKGNKLTYHT